jgi:hypothetical protein
MRLKQTEVLQVTLSRQAAVVLRRIARRRRLALSSLIEEGVTSVLRGEAFGMDLKALLKRFEKKNKKKCYGTAKIFNKP